MDAPKISVIVPVYNVEQYLATCIDSILMQTFSDFEVLLIDDGSTDRSGLICDEYANNDNRIKVFHKENGGVSSARNLGLDNAIGEWIGFVDADDWIERSLFTDAINIAETNNVDMVCWNYFIDNCYENKSSDFISNKLIIKKHDAMNCLLKMTIYPPYCQYVNEPHFNMTPIWNKLYKNNQGTVRFNTKLKRGEDALYNIQMLNYVSSAAFISQKLTHYVIRKTSAMHSYNENLFRELTTSLDVMKHNIDCDDTDILQCFMGRCVSYINEVFEHYLLLQKTMTIKNFKYKVINSFVPIIITFPVLKVTNILNLSSKITIYLLKHRYFNILIFYLYFKHFAKRIYHLGL